MNATLMGSSLPSLLLFPTKSIGNSQLNVLQEFFLDSSRSLKEHGRRGGGCVVQLPRMGVRKCRTILKYIMVLKSVATALLFVSLAAAASLPLPQQQGVGWTANRIESLPGYGRTKELSFSGYLSIDPSGRGSLTNGLFYWLYYSRNVPATDPLGSLQHRVWESFPAKRSSSLDWTIYGCNFDHLILTLVCSPVLWLNGGPGARCGPRPFARLFSGVDFCLVSSLNMSLHGISQLFLWGVL